MIDLGLPGSLDSEMSDKSFEQSLLKLLKRHCLMKHDEIQQALVDILKQWNSNSVFPDLL